MTLGIYCPQWEKPTHPSQLKCASRVIGRQAPYKDKPICVHSDRHRMECCKEAEYSIKISADIFQELPGYTCEHCGETYNNNYPCTCRFQQERENYMGAPIPAIQRVAEAAVSLNTEIDAMSRTLADGRRALGGFSEAVNRWQENHVGDPPGTYRNHIRGSWNLEAERDASHVPPDGLESMNPKHCDHFYANEKGNCKNLHWCFKVFGTSLQCQAVGYKEEQPPQEEHRRLEVD